MRMHSHWAAATAAVLALILSTALTTVTMTSPASARHHRHTRAIPHQATTVQPPATQPASARLEPPPPGAAPIAPPAEVSAATENTAPATNATSATVVDTRDVRAVLGKSIRSTTGEDMGRLVDVVVDRDGQPRAAIIDFGGFLGVGSRKIAVDWAALNFAPDDPKGNIITVELTRDQVKAAPEFKDGSPVVVLGALGGTQPPAATPPKTDDQKAPDQKDQPAQEPTKEPAKAPTTPPQAQEK
jgi:hypothetical protein